MKKNISGKNNPNYKDGRTLKKNYCVDCNKKLYDFKSQRCLSCKIKNQFRTGNIKNKGIYHYNWKGGWRNKLPKCPSCNKSIYPHSKLCKPCAMKERFKNGMPQATKDKLRISHKGILKGENHPNWQGGISKSPYSSDFNKELREKIRKRDNYQCQNKECGMTEEEHLIVYGRVLAVHHIDYNKNNCQEYNLIALCTQCNIRANYNRSYWIEYFKSSNVEFITGKDVL